MIAFYEYLFRGISALDDSEDIEFIFIVEKIGFCRSNACPIKTKLRKSFKNCTQIIEKYSLLL